MQPKALLERTSVKAALQNELQCLALLKSQATLGDRYHGASRIPLTLLSLKNYCLSLWVGESAFFHSILNMVDKPQ